MSFLRRIQTCRRFLDSGTLRIALRARRLIAEERLLDAKDCVLHDYIVREVGGDRCLTREVDVSGARAEIEHQIRQTDRRAILRSPRQHATRRQRLRVGGVDVDGDCREEGAPARAEQVGGGARLRP